MFNFLRKRRPKNALDDLIFAVYGNPPPQKRADVALATHIAYDDLLLKNYAYDKVAHQTTELEIGPIPYSTHDLAISVALHFLTRADVTAKTFAIQINARTKALEWHNRGFIAPLLLKSFDNSLYKRYKPRKPTIHDLIRQLIKFRVEVLSMVEISPRMIDELGDSDLSGMPEATIVTVTKSYFELLDEGHSRDDALIAIEQHRATICEDQFDEIVASGGIHAYLLYRMCIECTNGFPIPTDVIAHAVKETCRHFGFDHERC